MKVLRWLSRNWPTIRDVVLLLMFAAYVLAAIYINAPST